MGIGRCWLGRGVWEGVGGVVSTGGVGEEKRRGDGGVCGRVGAGVEGVEGVWGLGLGGRWRGVGGRGDGVGW